MHNNGSKRILIIIHFPERDIYWARYLEKKLKAARDNIEVRITTFFETLNVVYVDGFIPDSILCYTLRDEWSTVMITALKLTTGARVVAYENEGMFDYDDPKIIEKRIGKSERNPLIIDRYLYWGTKAANIFATELAKKGFISEWDQVGCCGYLNYEMSMDKGFCAITDEEKEYLNVIRRFSDRYDATILFLTAFVLADVDVDYFRVNGEIISDNEDEIQAYAKEKTEFFKEYRYRYFDFIGKYCKKNRNQGIIIKPHPGEVENAITVSKYKEHFSQYDNVFFIDRPFLMEELLPHVDSVVHYGSTVMLESYINGIPTVLLTMPGKRYFLSSTKEIELDGKLKCDFDFSAINFVENSQVDHYLLAYFNYEKKACRYMPSEVIVRELLMEESYKPTLNDKLISELLQTQIAKNYKKTIGDSPRIQFPYIDQ